MTNKNNQHAQLSPTALAFIGDAVYSLLVREYLIGNGPKPVNTLHRECVKMVNAKAQAAAVKKIKHALTETETAVFKRGRNAQTATPKSATIGEYHLSTGFEALIGYLHLAGETERIKQFFEMIIAPDQGIITQA